VRREERGGAGSAERSAPLDDDESGRDRGARVEEAEEELQTQLAPFSPSSTAVAQLERTVDLSDAWRDDDLARAEQSALEPPSAHRTGPHPSSATAASHLPLPSATPTTAATTPKPSGNDAQADSAAASVATAPPSPPAQSAQQVPSLLPSASDASGASSSASQFSSEYLRGFRDAFQKIDLVLGLAAAQSALPPQPALQQPQQQQQSSPSTGLGEFGGGAASARRRPAPLRPEVSLPRSRSGSAEVPPPASERIALRLGWKEPSPPRDVFGVPFPASFEGGGLRGPVRMPMPPGSTTPGLRLAAAAGLVASASPRADTHVRTQLFQ
jgi:hypothetical protein